MKFSGAELKVGLFITISIIIIGYMFFVLSPDSFKKMHSNEYYTIVQDASGIVKKTHVKTNGVIIGKVKDIQLLAESSRIDIEIYEDLKIPVGSKIVIKEKGLLGDVYVSIIRAPDEGNYITVGDFIPPYNDQVNISSLINIFGDIGKDIKVITKSLVPIFGGENSKRNMVAFFDNLVGIAEETKNLIHNNQDHIGDALQNISEVTASLKMALGKDGSALHQVLANLKQTTENLNTLTNASNLQKIDQIINSFDGISKSAKLVAAKIEKGEGTLGKLINDEKTLDDLHATLDGIKQAVSPVTKLKVKVDYHGEFRQVNGAQHYFDMIMKTRPDKFYLIGVTDLRESTKDTTTEDMTPPNPSQGGINPPIQVREKVREKKALRFNIQFGKRWYFAQIRFGLFETTGGIASDFFLLNDRMKLSLEAFDWDDQNPQRKTAHVKSTLSFLMLNHLYATAGIDDVTRVDKDTKKIGSPNLFIGAGISFDDDDLKAVLGTAALAR